MPSCRPIRSHRIGDATLSERASLGAPEVRAKPPAAEAEALAETAERCPAYRRAATGPVGARENPLSEVPTGAVEKTAGFDTLHHRGADSWSVARPQMEATLVSQLRDLPRRATSDPSVTAIAPNGPG